MEEFYIRNNNNKVKVDLDEQLFIRILQLTYQRDRRFYKILKSKYEQLTQRELNDKKMILENL